MRDLVTILESLSDAADTTKDPEALTEHVRRALAPVIAASSAEPGHRPRHHRGPAARSGADAALLAARARWRSRRSSPTN